MNYKRIKHYDCKIKNSNSDELFKGELVVACPQKENGYSPIANEILDAISKVQINGTQAVIIFQLWRYTYGFSRKSHYLSETFISKATGINKRCISREMKSLIAGKIITVVSESTFTKPRVIAFNKNYDEWLLKNRCHTVV